MKKIFRAALIAMLAMTVLLSLSSCGEDGAENEVLQVSSVSLNVKEYLFTDINDFIQLSAEVLPEEASDKTVTWLSSDSGVVTVDNTGLVRPKGDGMAIVTARSSDGSSVGCCVFNVGLIYKVGGIVLSSSQMSFESLDDSAQLSYTVLPEEATNKNVVWTTSNPAVANVDIDGHVTLTGDGQATITVTTEDGGYSSSCNISVNTVVPMVDVNFDKSEFVFSNTSDVLVLVPVWEPADTTERGLTWSSSDTSVATVDGLTGVVKALKNGTATIRALSENGLKQAVCKITVALPVYCTGLALDVKELKFTKKSQEYKLTATLFPEDTTNKAVTYESSAPSVAEVSSNGTITSVSDGTAVITVTTSDGGYKASAKVTVAIEPQKPESVSFDKYSCTLTKKGQTYTIKPIVLPEDAVNKNCTFASDDTSIATVDKNGVVTAVGDGIAFISVTTVEGGCVEMFYVNVSLEDSVSTGITIVHDGDLRGVWVATVGNLDFPSTSGLSAAELKSQIDAIVDTCAEAGLNAIFLQVRPESDALYHSSIFPSSTSIVNKQGDEMPLDCLAYFIKAAHAKNIELHAWINPYRISQPGDFGTDLTKLAATNPARLHPEWVVKHTDNAMYYNPGLPEVRQLIVDGVMEIVNNYDIDGIHFDDYFYPDSDRLNFADSAIYEKYAIEGQSLEDWRRSNTDALILTVYSAIKTVKPNVKFGVSPCGVWALKSHNALGTDVPSSMEAYYQVYADTRKWVVNEWLDYICPQVYWDINHSTAPFKPIVEWWNSLVSNVNVELYIGIAAYKGATADAYKDGTEIQNELAYLDLMQNVDGTAFFSYKNLKNNTAGLKDTLTQKYTGALPETEPSETVEGASDSLVLAYSKFNVDNSTTKAFILGVSDPNYPVYVDGIEVTDRTSLGYFSYRVNVPLIGENVYTVTHKGQSLTYTVKRASEYSEPTTMSSFGFVSSSFSPLNDYAAASGTKLTVSCIATAGAKVYAKIGDYTVQLSSSVAAATDGTYKRAWYQGTFVMPEVTGNAVIGGVTFYAEAQGQTTVVKELSNTVEVINDPDSYLVTVTKNLCNLVASTDDSPDEYYAATLGATDGVVAKWGGNTKLKSGLFIANSDVEKTEGTLSNAAVSIMTSQQSADGKYTEISFYTDSNMMNTVWMYDDRTEIVLYNVGSFPGTLTLSDNPLFSGISYKKNGTTVTVTLTHKISMHIFGYKPAFSGGAFTVSFKNPVSLSSGALPLSGIKISIDPGHSLDGGAVGPWGKVKWTEADWNYTLSQLVETKLLALGATTKLSHHRELLYDLDPLIEQFRAWEPDINISIHFNYVPDYADPLAIKGTETYYSFSSSKLLAKVMLEEFTENTGIYKRDYNPGYYKVSRFVDFPSILFETAFMSNINDYEWFTDDANMEKAADAIVSGIVEYFRQQS